MPENAPEDGLAPGPAAGAGATGPTAVGAGSAVRLSPDDVPDEVPLDGGAVVVVERGGVVVVVVLGGGGGAVVVVDVRSGMVGT
jgi:hypothetical protein